jgi:hypothetical protein
MSSIRLISAAFLLAAAAAPLACTIEKAPAQPPAAAPPPAPAATEALPAPVMCKPIGTWKVGGPTGSQSIRVTQNPNKPGIFDVWYNGVQTAQGGQVNNQHFTFDSGAASGGLASCDLAQDCKTMNCGFKGGQPVVFNKTE